MNDLMFYVQPNRKGGRGWYKPGALKAKFERRYLAFKQRSDARAKRIKNALDRG